MLGLNDMVPREVFFTKGVGRHIHKLQSFELALRDAGIEKQNLVRVSSIYPTVCKIIPAKEGQPKLKPGQITFVVLAEAATDEPNRLICAGIGLALPRNHPYGYIAEHHGYGMSEKKTEDLVEDLAATMLATTLGVPFDSDKAWDEREQQYKLSGEIVKTRAVVQTAEGDKAGLWTSVIAAAVFILDTNGNGSFLPPGTTASDIKTPAAAGSGSGSLLNPR
ncbi:MAG TPA: arginine decarboxylase, pyruvoyl-dependent [Tepidisphaeraceae bacterium]|jgi:arginine decarboxylase|nr:arginine decarboxylase, pyruvoyl-dependent [Tepidisphaeraceae bacterium]